jgi:acetyltransferase-like isoleucine patch superfamily enzyme
MRGALKRLAAAAAWLGAAPWALLYAVAALAASRARAFAWASQRAARWPGLWGAYRRRTLLRLLGGDVARDCHIEFGTLLSKPAVQIGPGAYVGAYCCLGDVRIGAKTMLADGVHVPSGAAQHGMARLDIPMADQPGCCETVTIGADCWIGAAAVILADVGDHAVVAAGAVVTAPVEPYAIVAGVPARPVGTRKPLMV